uniref:Uncharacterized protein n=1 Tax=Lepeophtheirus salmonis TaxID=72036 RepID=A0A0K2UCZ0_LEPSM
MHPHIQSKGGKFANSIQLIFVDSNSIIIAFVTDKINFFFPELKFI